MRYQVRDNTKISHLSVTSILSHDDTKNDIIKYLSHETFEINKTSIKTFTISFFSGATKSNNDNLKYPINTDEEAYTLMLFLRMEVKETLQGRRRFVYPIQRHRCYCLVHCVL